MAFDVNRWMKYARARIDSSVGEGNRSLDRLEAEREADVADKPWLRSETDAPTLDEARARIEWEAERQRQAPTPPSSAPAEPTVEPTAEQAATRLELEARQRESADRLDRIRKELGIAEPTDPAKPPPSDPA